MKDINRVVVVGRLTRSPELKSTNTGTYFCRFGIASNDSVKKNGEWKEEADFIDVICWGKKAEFVSKYIEKGKKVCVDGRLKYSSWENNEGKRMSKLEIWASDVEPLEKFGKEESIGEQVPTPEDSPFNDDIPF